MKEFEIRCWTYLGMQHIWDTLAKDYRDLGLTNAMTPTFVEGDDPQVMIKLLDDFQAVGLKATVRDFRIAAYFAKDLSDEEYRQVFRKVMREYGWHPALAGFMVGDEPGAENLEDHLRICRLQAEEAPHLQPTLALLPWYNTAERLGVDAYGPYLDRVITESKLPVLGFNCYGQMTHSEVDLDYYFNNLRQWRDATNRHGTDFWVSLLCSAHCQFYCPTQDDFRWQLATAAAMGAKGVNFFYVAAPARPDGSYRHFPISHFRRRTEAFEWLAEENDMFMYRYAKTLMKLRCVKTAFTNKAYGGNEWFASDDTLLSVHSYDGRNLLVSTFVDEEGNKYRAIVNMDKRESNQVRMTFAPGIRLEYLSHEEVWFPLEKESRQVGLFGWDESVAVQWLAPGQMEIIREIVE